MVSTHRREAAMWNKPAVPKPLWAPGECRPAGIARHARRYFLELNLELSKKRTTGIEPATLSLGS
jgi:hypothetical protein